MNDKEDSPQEKVPPDFPAAAGVSEDERYGNWLFYDGYAWHLAKRVFAQCVEATPLLEEADALEEQYHHLMKNSENARQPELAWSFRRAAELLACEPPRPVRLTLVRY